MELSEYSKASTILLAAAKEVAEASHRRGCCNIIGGAAHDLRVGLPNHLKDSMWFAEARARGLFKELFKPHRARDMKHMPFWWALTKRNRNVRVLALLFAAEIARSRGD